MEELSSLLQAMNVNNKHSLESLFTENDNLAYILCQYMTTPCMLIKMQLLNKNFQQLVERLMSVDNVWADKVLHEFAAGP